MVQKEVAEKLQAPVGTRNSGAITAAVNYYGTVEMLFTVPRDSFLPPPNVDSAVIRIDVQKRYAADTKHPKHFFAMLKNGFSQRRKTLEFAFGNHALRKAGFAGRTAGTGAVRNSPHGESDHGTAGGAQQLSSEKEEVPGKKKCKLLEIVKNTGQAPESVVY